MDCGQVETARPGWAAMGELPGGVFAEHDADGGVQAFAGEGIAGGDVVAKQLGHRGGADAGGVNNILEAVRDTVQRAARAVCGDLRVGGLRLMAGSVGCQGHATVTLTVEGTNPREIGVGQFHRGKLIIGDQAGGLGDGEEMQVHRYCSSGRKRVGTNTHAPVRSASKATISGGGVCGISWLPTVLCW
jgi:hypothetical protein